MENIIELALLNSIAFEWNGINALNSFISSRSLSAALAFSLMCVKSCFTSLVSQKNITSDPMWKWTTLAIVILATKWPKYSKAAAIKYPNGFLQSKGYLQLLHWTKRKFIWKKNFAPAHEYYTLKLTNVRALVVWTRHHRQWWNKWNWL